MRAMGCLNETNLNVSDNKRIDEKLERRKKSADSIFSYDDDEPVTAFVEDRTKGSREGIAKCVALYLWKRCSVSEVTCIFNATALMQIHLPYICPGGSCRSPGVNHCIYRAFSICRRDSNVIASEGKPLESPFTCIRNSVRDRCLVSSTFSLVVSSPRRH